MKIPIKIRLLFYWQKLFKSKVHKESLIKISKKGRGVKSVIFLLPSEKKQAQIAAHFIKNDDKKNEFRFHYILLEESLPFYSKNIIPNAHIIKDVDVNWFGAIISKPFLNRINKLKFLPDNSYFLHS